MVRCNPDPVTYGAGGVSLKTATGIALPAGQQTYLQLPAVAGLRVVPGRLVQTAAAYIDGGTVEVDAGPARGHGSPAVDERSAAGPADLPRCRAKPWAGRKAFAGDSFGWTSSQLDLSSFAGQTVRPQFTMRGDASDSFIGWWLDDIVVYTCDVPPTTPPSTPPVPTVPPTPTTPPGQQVSESKTTLKVKTGKSVKIVATVKTAGSATGTVTFKIDKKAIKKTVTIKNGKATLKLSKKKLRQLGSGKHKVKASYSGSTTAKASKAKATFNLR